MPVAVSAGAVIVKNGVAVLGSISSVIDSDTIALRVSARDYGLTETVTITVGTSSATWLVKTRPPAPLGVFAVSGTGQVTVSWAPVLGSTSYNIYWGTTVGVTAASTVIANATSPHVQTGLTAGTTYFYRVSTVNAAGETLSNEVFSFVYAGGNPRGNFADTGSMTTTRYQPTATLLPNGKVLVVGGLMSGITMLASAEIYDPATGIFTATGNMASARYGHTATLLPNGKVLIAGGYYTSAPLSSTPLSSAEIYDPLTGSFTATGSMTTVRINHIATLLSSGSVLVAGGGGTGSNQGHFASAEIYDPATGIFSLTGSMTTPREDNMFSGTLLPNGKILVVGGVDAANRILASAEIYDPATGTFSATGNVMTARYGNTVSLLPNGKVLISGGSDNGNNTLASAEIFDPATGTFSATGSMRTARYLSIATRLPNGNVLITGGTGGIASAEIYDSATGIFTATGSMASARAQHTATLLPNGKVLATGGSANSSAELFQ